MGTVKIKDKKTGAVKVVKKALASDYIGTGKFVLVETEKKQTIHEEKPRYTYDREEKQDAKGNY